MSSNLSSNGSSCSGPGDCFALRKSLLVLSSFSIASVLLVLPLCVLVLHLGFRRWRQRRGVSTATAGSQSDVFTYHMAVMETLTAVSCLSYCVSVGADLPVVSAWLFSLFFCFWSVKILFQALTSVELYLAVVRPVAYRGLRAGGRVRGVSAACVWLLCLLWGVLVVGTPAALVPCYFCFLAAASAVVGFCCVSVLRALQRRGPGEAGADGERVDPMKRRAFRAVAAIAAALWLCLGGALLCNLVASFLLLSDGDKCAVLSASAWFSLPSSAVLPVLYLHRAEKLPCCSYTSSTAIRT